LLRTEAMSITALMLQKFCRRKTLPHRLVPVRYPIPSKVDLNLPIPINWFMKVCLFTYSGFKVRVLQAYFEGDRMHVYKSDIVDFDRERNEEGLKRLVSWIACKPSGDTRWPCVPKDPYETWSSLVFTKALWYLHIHGKWNHRFQLRKNYTFGKNRGSLSV
jgi:hypothetical protein